MLLIICSMEQNGQEYQFVYDMEEDREKLLKWLSRDLFRDVYTIYGCMGEDAEWFLFNRDEDIIVREKTDEEGFEYVYYKFPYLGEGEYGTALPAYGKTSNYYFIQWEEEDYLIVTRRESSGETVDGVGVYSMLGDSLIGTVLCLDKDIDTIHFLGYVFAGTQPYDMRLPDY